MALERNKLVMPEEGYKEPVYTDEPQEDYFAM